jgi:hypothetical protein
MSLGRHGTKEALMTALDVVLFSASPMSGQEES